MQVAPESATGALGWAVLRASLADRTRSEPGRALADRLRPFAQHSEARLESERVSALQSLYEAGEPVPDTAFESAREDVRTAKPRGSHLEPEALVRIARLAETVTRLKAFYRSRSEGLPVLVEVSNRLEDLSALAGSIRSVVDEEGHIADNASPDLRRIRREMHAARAEARRAVLRAMRNASSEGWATEDQPTIRGGRMVIPVRAEAKRKVGGIVHDLSASGQTAFVEPAACVELNNDLRSLEAEERREILRILARLTDAVRAEGDSLLRADRAMAYVDLLGAKARWARDVGGIVPASGDDGCVELVGARNAELERRIGRETLVPLDLRLDQERRLLIISGPNAGGKSVALKTVGQLVLLAACGLPVPADPGTRIDRFDRLLVDIGDEQSVEDDLSTFSSHLAHWRQMVEDSDERTLVLIDEAGTGTDPDEGSALAQATLEVLLASGARGVVTTHHGPLKRFAHEAPGASNGMMRFDQEALRPTYQFESGVPGASYAFDIAERLGLQKEVTQRARTLLGSERVALEQLLSELQSRNADLERALGEAQAAAEDAQGRRDVLAERLEKLQEARGEIRTRALEDAEALLDRANAQIERTIREIKESQASKDVTKAARSELESFKEEVSRSKGRAKRKRPSKRRSTQSPTGPIEIGDQVALEGGATSGEVIELSGRHAVIAAGSGRLRVAVDRLRKVGGKRKQQVTVRQRGVTSSMGSAQTRIDLRGQRADAAVSAVVRLVDEALAAGLESVEILHGKGTGALRAAIHEYLESRPDIGGYGEAPVEAGGAGVTVVRI